MTLRLVDLGKTITLEDALDSLAVMVRETTKLLEHHILDVEQREDVIEQIEDIAHDETIELLATADRRERDNG